MKNQKSKQKCQIHGYQTANIVKANKNSLMIKYTHVKIENAKKSAFLLTYYFQGVNYLLDGNKRGEHN
ncbi:MAG: hypothetical protein ACP5QA_10660 [Phycisphaerae bacterium]